ncbi:hypothetical protein GWI33_011883 [Rhynchophorus ferrugineus]|uniref:Uncharacterized protein n=1 Tax=Rhynchophorus ferrugineus TaxID=354439 RepID=A0A834IC94_RHYFE|nr:hypothetical protein GWI33_011883 [Rhynchophorus ferrugineus]
MSFSRHVPHIIQPGGRILLLRQTGINELPAANRIDSLSRYRRQSGTERQTAANCWESSVFFSSAASSSLAPLTPSSSPVPRRSRADRQQDDSGSTRFVSEYVTGERSRKGQRSTREPCVPWRDGI